TLYAVTGAPEVTWKFEPPPNARRLVHVPLWGTAEPAEYMLRDVPWHELRDRRAATSDDAVEQRFLPLFTRLPDGLDVTGREIRDYGVVVHDLWRWFREHDWRRTWRSPLVYEAFRAHVEAEAQALQQHEQPSVADLSTTLHWLDNFLLPLAAPL